MRRRCMITPSPFRILKRKKGMPKTPPAETGIPNGALGVAQATPRRRCTLRERKCSDISAKIVWFYKSSIQKWQMAINLKAG